MKKLNTIAAFATALILFSAVNSASAQEKVIGTQTWSTKNLDVATFNNGDAIPEAKTAEEWQKAGEEGTPAWCYYDNNPANAKYGRLYNFYAVTDERGIAPAGWHVASYDEWVTLNRFLGGAVTDGASQKLKSTSGWSVNPNGTNSSGFNALPGGVRYHDGSFSELGSVAYFWTNTTDDSGAWFHLIGDESSSYNDFAPEAYGYSVRCVKD